MLDVHVLVMDYTPPAVVARCLRSVAAAADKAPFPVFIYPLPGVYGHLGRAREAGYALGNSPYVTYVDDDDTVPPEAFAALAPMLEADVNAVTTGELHLYEDGTAVAAPLTAHHLSVVKRAVAMQAQLSRFRFFPDQYLLSIVDAQHIPRCLYEHRIYRDSGSRRQRRENQEEAARERMLIRNPHLFAAEAMTALDISAALEAFANGDDHGA